jgi:hypothetical protein
MCFENVCQCFVSFNNRNRAVADHGQCTDTNVCTCEFGYERDPLVGCAQMAKGEFFCVDGASLLYCCAIALCSAPIVLVEIHYCCRVSHCDFGAYDGKHVTAALGHHRHRRRCRSNTVWHNSRSHISPITRFVAGAEQKIASVWLSERNRIVRRKSHSVSFVCLLFQILLMPPPHSCCVAKKANRWLSGRRRAVELSESKLGSLCVVTFVRVCDSKLICCWVVFLRACCICLYDRCAASYHWTKAKRFGQISMRALWQPVRRLDALQRAHRATS